MTHETLPPMKPSQYRAALKQLGLTIVGASEVLWISPRTSQRYAAGTTAVPKRVRARLEELLAFGRAA